MLTSLEGVPTWINGIFDCSGNHLVSLVGAPQYVKGNFDCSDNRLTTLKGIPKHTKVLYCTGNQIPGDILAEYKKACLFPIIGDEK